MRSSVMTTSHSPARANTVSLKLILWTMGLAMAATALYMAFIIRAVPKTVSNSKAGLFAELVDRLLVVYAKGEGLQPTSGRFVEKVGGEQFALKEAVEELRRVKAIVL